MPSKPQPFRLPQRYDSPTLAKFAIPGEPTVIVRAVGIGSTAPFEYSDRNGRQAIFRYEREYDTHVLKVPASVWNANKGFMAHELMDQRRLPHPLVVTVDIPLSAEDVAKQSPGAAWIKAFGLLSTLAPKMVINVDDPIGMAETIVETLSKSQDGQVVKSSGPYPEAEGSTPSPATNSPEMDASGKSEESSDVVVGQDSEQPGASASVTSSSVALAPLSGPGLTGDELLTDEAAFQHSRIQVVPADTTTKPSGVIMHKDKPMFSAAWDMLQSPMRLKELAAALETDPDTLKTALQDPLSTVELGHAGWVKRREPT